MIKKRKAELGAGGTRATIRKRSFRSGISKIALPVLMKERPEVPLASILNGQPLGATQTKSKAGGGALPRVKATV